MYTNTDLWAIENALYQTGNWELICGVDEAGAGPLAGPVYAAAVILPRNLLLPGLNDSKKLSAKKREALFDEIQKQAVAYAIASVDEKMIDEINILNARMLAMDQAICSLVPSPGLALIDGNCSRGIQVENQTVVDIVAESLRRGNSVEEAANTVVEACLAHAASRSGSEK